LAHLPHRAGQRHLRRLSKPAYLASISQLVPKQNLGRASGLMQLGQSLEIILSPALARLLLTVASAIALATPQTRHLETGARRPARQRAGECCGASGPGGQPRLKLPAWAELE
jgi:hypothetical protein